MKKLALIMSVSVVTAMASLQAQTQYVWNFGAAPTVACFNDDSYWTGGTGPKISGGDSVRLASWSAPVVNIWFGSDTIISQTTASGTNGAFWMQGPGTAAEILTFTGRDPEGSLLTPANSLTIRGTTHGLRFQDTKQTKVVFDMPVIFQSENDLSLLVDNLANVRANSMEITAQSPLQTDGLAGMTFTNFILRGTYANEEARSWVAPYTYNNGSYVDIQKISDYYTNQGEGDMKLTSTGRLVLAKDSSRPTKVRIDDTSDFTGEIYMADNATLTLGSNLNSAVTLTLVSSVSIFLESTVTSFSHTINRDGAGVGMTFGALANAYVNVTSYLSFWGGSGNITLRADAGATLLMSGTFRVSAGSRAIAFTGPGTILIDSTATSQIGNLVNQTTPVTSAILGGKGVASWTIPTTLKDGAGLTTEFGSLRFTGGLLGDVTLDLTQMETAGKLFFTIKGESTTSYIFADKLLLGAIDGEKFTFTLGSGFEGSGIYSIFSSKNAITMASLDTSAFSIAENIMGSLSLSPDSKSIFLTVATIPEPTTWALLGASLLVVTVLRRRKGN